MASIEARRAELEDLSRMALRKIAIKLGMDHNDSLNYKHEDLLEWVLEQEFGGEATEEPDKKPARKAAARKPAGKKPAGKKAPAKKPAGKKGGKAGTAAPPPSDAATKEDLGNLAAVVDSHSDVLNEHSETHATIVANQETIIEGQRVLAGAAHLVCQMYMEPEDAAAVAERLGGLLEDPS